MTPEKKIQLRQRRRTVVRLRQIGMPYVEIGKIFSLSPQRVHQIIVARKQKLAAPRLFVSREWTPEMVYDETHGDFIADALNAAKGE